MSVPTFFDVRILRKDHPDQPSYWQTFRVDWEQGMNVTSVLQRIAANPCTASGEHVAPVAYEAGCLEEVCGSCTMLINGRVRQACSALVDRLLAEHPGELELQPMSKFPVVRDLFVDRQRLFRALEKLECWIPVDGYFDMGAGPRQSPEAQQMMYVLSTCMSCGCCLEACPQYAKIELRQRSTEDEETFEKRKASVFDTHFIGAHANSQAVLINNHPIGKVTAKRRVDTLISAGGIQNCGKAGNCQAVCPKNIPLMDSWGRSGRAATIQIVKEFFEGK
jgi:succinate dehydrogenase / fumarate reductase, iron-sulfur subunit